MSFEFSPETLAHQVKQQILSLQTSLEDWKNRTIKEPQLTYYTDKQDYRDRYGMIQSNYVQRLDQQGEFEQSRFSQETQQKNETIANLNSQIASLTQQYQLLLDEASVRASKVIPNVSNPNTQPISGQTNKIPILPIIAAAGVGLLIFTAVRRKRK